MNAFVIRSQQRASQKFNLAGWGLSTNTTYILGFVNKAVYVGEKYAVAKRWHHYHSKSW